MIPTVLHMYKVINSKPCFICCLNKQHHTCVWIHMIVTLCHKNVTSNHLSVLFDLIMPLLLLLLIYATIIIQHDSIINDLLPDYETNTQWSVKEPFIIVTVPLWTWWLHYKYIDCRNTLRNITDHCQGIATWVLPSNCHMAVLGI